MKLKEGMYVRTKEGLIDKVIIDYKGCCNSPNCNCKHVSCEHNYYDEENIIKASYNIIDLIEVGDYVNGELVVQVSNDKGWVFTEPVYFDEYRGEEKHYCYNNSEIKSVATKELFDSVKYEVE